MTSRLANSTTINRIYLLILILLSLSTFIFYLRYAFHAWFLQDDFGFLAEYANSINFTDIIHPSNDFGRFISRNIYWHLMQSIFNQNATLYFVTNFLLLCTICFFIYQLLIALKQNSFIALAAAISYFISMPTLYNYTWLSNTQHLIAHAFIFLFLVLSINTNVFEDRKYLLKIGLIILYILGIYANALMLFALPPLLFYLFLENKLNINNISAQIYIALLVLITIVFITISKHNAIGVYQTNINWPIFKQNILYYLFDIYKPRYTLPLSIIGIGYGLYYALRRHDHELLFLITASCSFYLPFAFLEYQHYPNYMALPFFFLMTSIILIFKNYRLLVIGLIILQLIMLNKNVLAYYKNHPAGADVHRFITQLNQIPMQNLHTNTICLHPSKPHDLVFWWALDSGQALQLFGNKNIKYILLDNNVNISQNCVVVTIDEELHIISTKYPP